MREQTVGSLGLNRIIGPLLLFLLSGCAAMNTLRPEEVEGGRWNKLRRSGLAFDASHNWLSDAISEESPGSYFTPDNPKVTWWGLFSSLAFLSPGHVTLLARWFDPLGNLFLEREFSLHKDGWDSVFAKTSLPIATTPAREFHGRWHVEIHYQGYQIDEKSFYIIPQGAPLQVATPPQQVLQPVANFVPKPAPTPFPQPPPPEPNRDDAFFEEHHAKAQFYFEKGRYKEAQEHLTQILEKQPFRTEVHLALAAVYYREHLWDDALRELDYLLQNPDYREAALKIRSEVLRIKEKGGQNV